MEGGFRSIMHLSYRDYRSVPEELRATGKDEIDEIYLKENLIVSLPDWFFVEMTHLRFLCLAGNMIESIPGQIGRLECLETLDLSENALHRLPPTVGMLKRLNKLLLNGNCLTHLPAEIGHLRKLEVLEVRKNRLTNIPIQLSGCVALEDLLVDDNLGLVSIPTPLFNLPALTYVSAEGCNLFQLPFFINTSTLRFVRVFSHNHCLTHCPLALKRFAQHDYVAVEERLQRIRNPSCYRQVQCRAVPYRLNLPGELSQLSDRGDASVRPNSLLEETLRTLARSGLRLELLEQLRLPECLTHPLLHGPVAYCASVPCGKEIFSAAVLALVQRRDYALNFVLSVLFCSKLCADRWFQYNCDRYVELPWEVVA
uniref:Disease resistance R13L4/SHOC-2-like LRR domain-containing protein n=1 Tax=Anopheles farauti TaxID=69004 RepID=A0A182QB73_9DIPT